MTNQLNIALRAVEPTDLDLLFELENSETHWEVTNTRIPFSKHTLKNYLESVQDIYADRQLRMVIELGGIPCGLMDWFDFDPFHQRAGLGIVVAEPYRNGGVARSAVEKAIIFSQKNLGLRLLFCNILAENVPSIRLFEGAGFVECGIKKNWHRSPDGDIKDEKMFLFNC